MTAFLIRTCNVNKAVEPRGMGLWIMLDPLRSAKKRIDVMPDGCQIRNDVLAKPPALPRGGRQLHILSVYGMLGKESVRRAACTVTSPLNSSAAV